MSEDSCSNGDRAGYGKLFALHRERLQHAIAMQLDPRVGARLDASDIVQETYQEAARRLPEYMKGGGMPFYLWLRWIAREKVIAIHRKHLAEKRDVRREVGPLAVDSSAEFVSGVIGRGPTPSRVAARRELAERLRRALGLLDDDDREIITWRHFEHLSNGETAQLLRIGAAAASKRYVRALEKLRGHLSRQGISGPG